MAQRLGNVIYWTASGAAVLVFFVGVLTALTQPGSPRDWIVVIVAYSVPAVLIWLAGLAARYILAG